MKVKGALPAPKVSPVREFRPWYRRRRIQVILALVLATLAILATKGIFDARKRAAVRADEKRAFRQFEKGLTLVDDQIRSITGEMRILPEQFKAGTAPAGEFRTKATGWVDQLNKLEADLRKGKVPDKLVDGATLIVQGAAIYLDAANAFALAAEAADAALRDRAIQSGTSLLDHADGVYAVGRKLLNEKEARAGLVTTQQLPTQQFPGSN